AWAWVVLVGVIHLPVSAGDCQEYFKFPSENHPSLFDGKWVTVASTRRLMPCHTLHFSQNGSRVVVEEGWKMAGWSVSAWHYNTTATLTLRDEHLFVTDFSFDGLLMGGRVDMGVVGDHMLMMQCLSVLSVPVPAISVLSRSVPSDAAAVVMGTLEHFKVPRTGQDVALVQHAGCQEVSGVVVGGARASIVDSGTLDDTADFLGALVPDTPQRTWSLVDSPDNYADFV
ncbi:hypothetical protein OTU49_012090, partial [Cherax quadricarinatus]